MNKSSWDDIKFVLAVADSGSVNTAARVLGVTHATVLRRVANFEDRHGRRIFARAATGYRLLPGSEAVLNAAREVESAVFGVQRAITGTDRELSGHVRITSTDSLCQLVLPGLVARLTADHPHVTISLLSANLRLDLARLSADVTVRPAEALSDGLIGRVATRLEFAVYSGAGNGRNWLRLDGVLAGSIAARWMAEALPPESITQGSDSFVVLREMLAVGGGATYLPRFVGAPDKRLRQRDDLGPRMSVPVWVAGQEDTRDNPRFRMVRDVLAKELAHVWDGL